LLKPFALTSVRAALSRSHSSSIHPENSPESWASARSARATGSSTGFAARTLDTAPRNRLGGVMTSWSA